MSRRAAISALEREHRSDELGDRLGFRWSGDWPDDDVDGVGLERRRHAPEKHSRRRRRFRELEQRPDQAAVVNRAPLRADAFTKCICGGTLMTRLDWQLHVPRSGQCRFQDRLMKSAPADNLNALRAVTGVA